MPPMQPQIDELKRRLDRHEERLDDADTLRTQTHNMVAEMHRALMEPQYGHGEKSLLQRMAEVTVEIEGGTRAFDQLVSLLKKLAFVGTGIAAIGAVLLKLEFWKG